MNLALRYQFLSWGALIAYMCLIFFLSGLPVVPLPESFPHQDKVIHFLAYCILGILARGAFHTSGVNLGFWPYLFCLVYAFTDEFHQSFVPGRDSSFYDWLADAMGSGFAVYVIYGILLNHVLLNLFMKIQKTADQ